MIIVLLDLVTFFTTAIALFFYLKGRKKIAENDIKLLILILIVFLLVYSFLLWTEWANHIKSLEKLEDFFGALMPMFFAFLFYALVKHAMVDKIHKSEKLLRVTLNSSSNGVITAKRNGTILEMNPAAEKLTGYTFQNEVELKLDKVLQIVDTLNFDKFLIDRILHMNERFDFPSSIKLTSKNGEEFQISLTVSPIRDEEEKIQGVVIIFHDLSEEYKARKALAESEERFRMLFERSDDAIFFIDTKNEKVLNVNKAAERLSGLSIHEIRNMKESTAQVKNVNFTEIVKQKFDQITNLGEVIYVSPQGFKKIIMVTIIPLHGDLNCIIAKDVTEMKKTQELMVQNEKMLSVGGLAAGMAHEINNPLAGMMQNATVLQNKLTKDIPANHKIAEECGTTLDVIKDYMEKRNVLKHLELIHDSGERASVIVKNMLNFSRKSESHFELVDLHELVEEVLGLAGNDYDLKKRYDFKKIEIERDYELHLPKCSCDEGKIKQVVLNILKNGAQAMAEKEHNSPKFILRLKSDNKNVILEIEDNGSGIPDKIKNRIFEPFFTTKPNGKGTGLGMSISYFIVTDDHKGELSVESELGKYTRFIIKLPYKKT